VVVQDDVGKMLARRRLAERRDWLARFGELVASCRSEDGEPDLARIVVVIETRPGAVGEGAGRRRVPDVCGQP